MLEEGGRQVNMFKQLVRHSAQVGTPGRRVKEYWTSYERDGAARRRRGAPKASSYLQHAALRKERGLESGHALLAGAGPHVQTLK